MEHETVHRDVLLLRRLPLVVAHLVDGMEQPDLPQNAAAGEDVLLLQGRPNRGILLINSTCGNFLFMELKPAPSTDQARV